MKLLTKVMNLIKRGYVSNSLPDTADYSQVQVSYMGNSRKAAVINPYGLYTRLPLNTNVIMFSVNGQEENSAVVGYSREDRFKNLNEGEVLIGNPETGSYIKFESDNKIEILSKGDLNIDVTGNVNLKASTAVNVDSPATNLGTGGNQIARLGDQITVIVGGTPYTGNITSAGVNTSI
jgi:hypothetical protein